MPDREDLLDEEALVRRSLEDLDRERAAGDIEEADYDSLHARYSARAAELAESLKPAPASPGEADGARPTTESEPSEAGPGVRRRSRLTRRRRGRLAVTGLGCLVIAAVFLSLALAGVAPFASLSPPTLTVAERIRIELGEAGVLAADHKVNQAVDVYNQVLALDAHQPQALADEGWLVRVAGVALHRPSVVRAADAEIALAVQFAPRYGLARAYAGVARLEDAHDAKGAVTEFEAMLSDDPTATLLRSVRSYAVAAFRQEARPVPGAILHA